MSFARFSLALTLFASLAGCAPAGPEPTDLEDASESDERALEGDTTYVITGRDFKKCAYPMCGGVYVKAVNKAKTTCFDGTKQAECYVGDLNLSALGLPEEQAGIVRNDAIDGNVRLSGKLEPLMSVSKLVVSGADDCRTEAPATGTYYYVESSGIVCITTPCPSVRARNANSPATKLLTDLDFSALGLSAEEAAATMGVVMTKSVLMSGVIKTQGNTKKLVVSQIFDPVEPALQLCLTQEACGESSHCDMTECLSGCAPGMVCTAVCHGACKPGPLPPPPGASCLDACGGAAADSSCYCDAACDYYGDCCSDYVTQCL